MRHQEILKRVKEQVDHNFEDQLQFLSKLVQFQSLVGQEGDAQKFYADACAGQGLNVLLLELSLIHI